MENLTDFKSAPAAYLQVHRTTVEAFVSNMMQVCCMGSSIEFSKILK